MRFFKLFIDESGDHGLVNINEDFPMFVLCGILTESKDYEIIRQSVNEIKKHFWGEKKVIFHSRDIRKCEKEFVVLFDENKKKEFYDRINDIFSKQQITIIASAIDKNNYVIQHGKLGNDVYEIALSFLIEKCLDILIKQFGSQFELNIFIEKRGRKEDQKLSEHFQRIRSRGTGTISSQILTERIVEIEFRHKGEDINGLQLADLAAYPIARYLIDTERANPAFEVLRDKIFQEGDKLDGLMIYPQNTTKK